MNIAESFRVALEGIWANKLRSSLTMLGIIIGITSVIAIMTLGQGGQQALNSQIAKLGANMFNIYINYDTKEDRKSNDLTIEDAETLSKINPNIKAIVPGTSGSGMIIGPKKEEMVRISGSTSKLLTLRPNNHIVKGRFFTENEDRDGRPVIVLESELADKLFGKENPIGQRVQINNASLVVVGLYKEDKMMLNNSQTSTVYMPIRFHQYLYDFEDVYFLEAQAASKETLQQAMDQAIKYLNRKHDHKEHYQAESLDSFVGQFNTFASTLTLIFSVVAGISLLVGGIGVMNIMLVSVTERTREIGIRKALGARRRDILNQFLIESVIVCLIGGTFGILFGLGSAALVFYFLKLPFMVSMNAIVISFAFSTGIGIFFGLYPANKAAKLEPIEALRYE